jgi:3'-phosphoadenosine 5'-phosphosulfate sulfotransferase (PAPS reductase)/FAD synthetase
MKLNLIGLSSGKDSTALLGWAIHESGYPRESIVCVFTDTENEYEEVYQQIRDLNAYCAKHGVAQVVYLRASGDWVDKFWMFPLFLALAVWKGRFPSSKARFCTEFLKIKPLEKFIAELRCKGHEITSHSGVRASESHERAAMEEYAQDIFGCKTRRPLLKWTISDVWEAHRKWDLPINPLYRMGWKRVGCRICIMSNKADVRRTLRKRPEILSIYRGWELIVGAYRVARGSITDYSSWFHRKTVPLRFRSRAVNTKKGMMNVATIDDVAKWSMTQRGAKLQITKEMLDEEDFNLDDSHAPCQSGLCE